MKRRVYDKTGVNLLREEEAEPVCGEDFCDRCGDCLHCYGGEDCFYGGPDNGAHVWTEYETEDGGSE
jgi:hypothetical protein